MLTPEINAKIKAYVVQEIKKAWAAKGHNLSNSLVESLEFMIADTFIDVLMNDYGVIQDEGVRASKVPFNGRGNGGTSKYIQGLMDYVERRIGIAKGTKENKAVAFAIAHTHKKTGIRTKERGKGSKWLTSVISQMEAGIANIIEAGIANDLEVQIFKQFGV